MMDAQVSAVATTVVAAEKAVSTATEVLPVSMVPIEVVLTEVVLTEVALAEGGAGTR